MTAHSGELPTNAEGGQKMETDLSKDTCWSAYAVEEHEESVNKANNLV